MLTEIHVENFALMEEIELSFSRGLTIFTGETGTGKSMLIDALGVLLGGRASADFIRHGLDKAWVEGIFEECPPEVLEGIEDAGYPLEEGQLILSREINRNGKNICRVQGRTVPLTLYRNLVQGLVDIHGQMEHQSLFNPDSHRGLLDAFGGEKQLELLSQVNKLARAYRSLMQKEQQLLRSEADRERREDILRFQIDEITAIDPQPNEEETLVQEKKRLANSEKIMGNIGEMYALLYEGGQQSSALDQIGRCRKALQDLVRYDENCNHMLEPMDSIYYTIEDLASQVSSYRDGFDFNPGRLDEIEERLIQLQRLRKYGHTVQEVLHTKDEMMQELHTITNLQEELGALRRDRENILRDYEQKAKELTQARLLVAKHLAEGLKGELADLGLEKSSFEVKLTSLHEPQIGGAEEAEFYFSANLGEPPKPLAKVASGGEMSRLMLALKSLLSKIESVSTFVFDEVDSGVGGRTIQKVGDKLAKIAENKQVFCITHAALVAAFGEHHFGIQKEISNGRTRTRIQLLSEEERIHELARMLGGEEEAIALEHARKLMKNIY
ncbi:DNA replication and repair protein RecN [Desulfitobacterium dichloroeliminans LMG P-21439]|uniref:DNA repair protein RecN n=1 Tax=Desulfitobacterium dichloroeliminans (strain LMG P-21439 / DCA1) TaxID=871963 RepID=L0F9X7_DESDL|nr:DNA repair protein RecN [Desulfitobacterium dichloroeliminans]AGA69835.1 DNA replication and repair protein RecN [Desulfitobacterium dichloroeliminans LMG P-21439]